MHKVNDVKILILTIVLAGLVFVAVVYGASEWKLRQIYDVPLIPVSNAVNPDQKNGERMAKIVGCWAGCHGVRGEGGVEEIDGIRRITAPPLGSVIPEYSDPELNRLILRGIKRDGRSAVGMNSYNFWHLGDQELSDIIFFLRAQPDAEPVERHYEISLSSRINLLRGNWKLSADQVDPSVPRLGNMPRDDARSRGQFLASLVCAECHGVDFLGNALEGGPPLGILAAYNPAQFERLMKQGLSSSGIRVEAMSWVSEVEFTEQDIADIYEFLTNEVVDSERH